MFDSVFRSGKNYYPQVFLEECKYVVKEKKMPRFITKDTEIYSQEVIKKILMKKIPIKKIIMKNKLKSFQGAIYIKKN